MMCYPVGHCLRTDQGVRRGNAPDVTLPPGARVHELNIKQAPVFLFTVVSEAPVEVLAGCTCVRL